MHKISFKTFLLIIIITYSCSWAQTYNISSTIKDECKGNNISFLNIDMKYPITVSEAKKEYDLKYYPTHYFYKKVKDLPELSPNVPYNFYLIFHRQKQVLFDDIPEENFLDKPVKGYVYLFQGATNEDSLMIELEKQFGGKFIKKENKRNRSLNMKKGLFYNEMKVSDCLHVAMSDYGPTKNLIWLCFYFDIPDNEREWFPL